MTTNQPLHHRATHGLSTGQTKPTYEVCRAIWRRHLLDDRQSVAAGPPVRIRGEWEDDLASFVRGVIGEVGLRPAPRSRLEPCFGPTIFRGDPFGDPELGEPWEEDPWDTRRTLEREWPVLIFEPGLVWWVEPLEVPKKPKPAKYVRGLWGPHPDRNERRRLARARRAAARETQLG